MASLPRPPINNENAPPTPPHAPAVEEVVDAAELGVIIVDVLVPGRLSVEEGLVSIILTGGGPARVRRAAGVVVGVELGHIGELTGRARAAARGSLVY